VGPPSRLQTQSHLRLKQVAFVVYVTSRQPMVASAFNHSTSPIWRS